MFNFSQSFFSHWRKFENTDRNISLRNYSFERYLCLFRPSKNLKFSPSDNHGGQHRASPLSQISGSAPVSFDCFGMT